jgi:hypothetical protein
MIPSNVYVLLHTLFVILLFFSVFIIPYTESLYLITIFIYIYVIWTLYGCIFLDYEAFIKCYYENDENFCHLSNRDSSFENFTIFTDIWSVTLWICVFFLIYRYTNQINFISFPYAHVYLPLSIFIIFLNLILLLGPAYHHYKQFKNNKILLLYVVSVIGCTTMFVYYLQQNEIEE